MELLALFTGQFRPSQIGVREDAQLEDGAAKVSILEVCPHEAGF
jgi:hypothetical protein